jgi:hypothetical protein
MTDVGSCPNQFCSTVFEELTVSIVDLTVANISFLLRQNWLGPEPTSVITVSNYWAVSWLTKDSHVYTLVWKHTNKWWNIYTFQIPSAKKRVM